MRTPWMWALAALSVTGGLSGCAHGKPAVASHPVEPTASAVPEDPVIRLIALADDHLAAGVAESKAGHILKAREAFDRALDTYLTAPGGAHADVRLSAAYTRTLEAIQVQEAEILGAGDGFTETSAEPAAIDDVAELPVAEAMPASEEVRRTTEEVVRTESNDLPIILNDAVLACIELYQGALREWFGEALARGGRYLPHIREVFKAEGIPQDLAYVAMVESAFRTQALSRAKAKGVWQFIAATGRRFGLEQDWWIDERSNPEKATRAAARYLKQLYGMFGDWNLALAAYNAGEGRIRRAVDRYDAGDFWQLSGARGRLPRETRNYVPMIHAAILVAKAPEKYGFDVDPEPPLVAETVPVKGAVDLRVIAECAGAGVDDVRLLNPELRRLATPANRTYPLRVPAGTGAALASCLEALPPEKRVSFRTHVVARGQTLSGIARLYGSNAREIAAANGLRSMRRLSRGTELIIPVRASAAVVRNAANRPAGGKERSAGLRAEPTSDTVRIQYRVKKGDTLAGIASKYGTTVRRLQSWNGLRGTRIEPGDTLTLFARKGD